MYTSVFIVIIIFSSLCFGIVWGYFSAFIQSSQHTAIQNNLSLDSLEQSIIDLVEQTSPSVVSIIATTDLTNFQKDPWWLFSPISWTPERVVSWWSWFFITPNGIIVTSNHVVTNKNLEYTALTNSWESYPVSIIKRDTSKDIAFLQIESDHKKKFIPLDFALPEEITVGRFSIAVGNSLWQYQNSVSFGIISGTNRSIHNDYINLEWLIQTDTAIHPWNSGWPLVNLEWKVMGVNTVVLNSGYNIWFATPLSQEYIDTNISSIKKGL